MAVQDSTYCIVMLTVSAWNLEKQQKKKKKNGGAGIENSSFADMKAVFRGRDIQPLQVNGDNTCKAPLASPLQMDAT